MLEDIVQIVDLDLDQRIRIYSSSELTRPLQSVRSIVTHVLLSRIVLFVAST